MSKLRNLSATVLLIVLVVFLMAGCGGGEATPTKASTKASTKGAVPAGGASTNKAENQIGTVISPSDLTPNDFKRSLESRHPIVVTFYMTGPYDDYQVRSFITTLETKYRGQVDFYDYLYTDAQRYGDLASLLMVNSPPTVVTINKQAKVQRAWTGYVDADSLEQGIVEAMR